MSAKKLSDEEFDSSDGLGPVITRTTKKAAEKKAPQKKGATAAEIEARDEELLHHYGAIAFTSDFIERLVLLFNLPCVIAFCKCAMVWAYADGNDEMVDLLAAKYAELIERHRALRTADEV